MNGRTSVIPGQVLVPKYHSLWNVTKSKQNTTLLSKMKYEIETVKWNENGNKILGKVKTGVIAKKCFLLLGESADSKLPLSCCTQFAEQLTPKL